eukprot:gene20064-15336_t
MELLPPPADTSAWADNSFQHPTPHARQHTRRMPLCCGVVQAHVGLTLLRVGGAAVRSPAEVARLLHHRDVVEMLFAPRPTHGDDAKGSGEGDEGGENEREKKEPAAETGKGKGAKGMAEAEKTDAQEKQGPLGQERSAQ